MITKLKGEEVTGGTFLDGGEMEAATDQNAFDWYHAQGQDGGADHSS
jgi:hypothetical protein